MYRKLQNIPSLETLTSQETYCGAAYLTRTSFSGFLHTQFCRPDDQEKSCCLNFATDLGKCVEKKRCRTENQQNSLDLDVSEYTESELSTFKPFDGDLQILAGKMLQQKLSGRNITIVGDSHSRGMFITLVALLIEDFDYPVINENDRGARTNCYGHYKVVFLK